MLTKEECKALEVILDLMDRHQDSLLQQETDLRKAKLSMSADMKKAEWNKLGLDLATCYRMIERETGVDYWRKACK